jgi:hypothetical protein
MFNRLIKAAWKPYQGKGKRTGAPGHYEYDYDESKPWTAKEVAEYREFTRDKDGPSPHQRHEYQRAKQQWKARVADLHSRPMVEPHHSMRMLSNAFLWEEMNPREHTYWHAYQRAQHHGPLSHPEDAPPGMGTHVYHPYDQIRAEYERRKETGEFVPQRTRQEPMTKKQAKESYLEILEAFPAGSTGPRWILWQEVADLLHDITGMNPNAVDAVINSKVKRHPDKPTKAKPVYYLPGWGLMQLAPEFRTERSPQEMKPGEQMGLFEMSFSQLVKSTYQGKGKRTGSPGHYKYDYDEPKGKKPFGIEPQLDGSFRLFHRKSEGYIELFHPWTAEKALEIANDIGDDIPLDVTWRQKYFRRFNRLSRVVPCSTCRAKVGQTCRRNSGHNTWLEEPHAARKDLFDAWLLAKDPHPEWAGSQPAPKEQMGLFEMSLSDLTKSAYQGKGKRTGSPGNYKYTYDDDDEPKGQKPCGDCFEANGRYFMQHMNNNPSLRLVHGEVTGQGGAVEGVNFAHAWVEDLEKEVVIDKSNGNTQVMPTFDYYILGAIGHNNNVFKYDHDQFVKQVVKHKHWGPWDLKTEKSMSFGQLVKSKPYQGKGKRTGTPGHYEYDYGEEGLFTEKKPRERYELEDTNPHNISEVIKWTLKEQPGDPRPHGPEGRKSGYSTSDFTDKWVVLSYNDYEGKAKDRKAHEVQKLRGIVSRLERLGYVAHWGRFGSDTNKVLVGRKLSAEKKAKASQQDLFRGLWRILELFKARPHKYIRRVPKPGGGYRYYYAESALAREVEAGEEVYVGDKKVEVAHVSDDSIRITIDGGESRTISHDEWYALIEPHYKEVHKSAEKRARQALRAVYRHVPKRLLKELRGETDAERFEDLKKRMPQVYAKLQKSFRRAGISPQRAKEILSSALERRGWNEDARATLIGQTLLSSGGAWALSNFRCIARGATSLAGGDKVEAGHVEAAADLLRPKTTKSDPNKDFIQLAKQAEKQLKKLTKALEKATADPSKSGGVLAQLLASDAIQRLDVLQKAYPGVRANQVVLDVDDALRKVPSVSPRDKPIQRGSDATFFVAGENGGPQRVNCHYKLIEAQAAVPSHNPEDFSQNEKYPEGLQERPYHTDKTLQQGVRDNAQRMEPDFLINTNPDATNGPPVMTADNIVLGGNSRAMSIQRVFMDGGESMEKYKDSLRKNIADFGLQEQDIDAMKQPMLVRVVEPEDTGDANLKLLVRQMNENFTKALDPRAMQVAQGRRIDDATLNSLADSMGDETLRAFLMTSRAKPFLTSLRRIGLIDKRNENQYFQRRTSQLNSDGVTLVQRVLVGKVVGDPDLLSDTLPKTVEALGDSVPFMIQAEQGGKGYNIREDLRHALGAFNELAERGELPSKTATGKQLETQVASAKEHLRDMFREDHPVLQSDPDGTPSKASQLLDVLFTRRGKQQMSRVFRRYATQAQLNPEGAGLGLIAEKTSAQVFRDSMVLTAKAEKEEAVQKKEEEHRKEKIAASLWFGGMVRAGG